MGTLTGRMGPEPILSVNNWHNAITYWAELKLIRYWYVWTRPRWNCQWTLKSDLTEMMDTTLIQGTIAPLEPPITALNIAILVNFLINGILVSFLGRCPFPYHSWQNKEWSIVDPSYHKNISIKIGVTKYNTYLFQLLSITKDITRETSYEIGDDIIKSVQATESHGVRLNMQENLGSRLLVQSVTVSVSFLQHWRIQVGNFLSLLQKYSCNWYSFFGQILDNSGLTTSPYGAGTPHKPFPMLNLGSVTASFCRLWWNR